MSDWGDRIRQRRDALGLNQTQLAKLCGLRPPSINDWESGKTKMIDGRNLVVAARALQTSPQWIMTGEALPPASQSVGIDPEILADAMKLLRATDAILGEPPEASVNPYRLAVAYQAIVEMGGTVNDGNVIDFTARLAKKLREKADHGAIGQEDSGAGGEAGGTHRAKRGARSA